MRTILLGILSFMLACITYAGAAAHGNGFDAAEEGALFAAPVSRGLCIEAADCSLKEARGARRAQRDIGRYKAPPEILEVIDAASATTEVDFDYLLRAAALESSFNPDLKATTSSAVGLYQFIEQSWFYMIQKTGAEVGLEGLAEAIGVGDNGYEVAEAEVREEILRLRYDPELSAILAGLFTRRNFEALARALEREPNGGELYVAHVLGASGAAELIRLAARSPEAMAVKHFRRAARANRAIFYHKNRKPRSVAEVYEFLTDKYRKIPVEAGDEVSVPSVPSMSPPRQISGDEMPYAMLWLRAQSRGEIAA